MGHDTNPRRIWTRAHQPRSLGRHLRHVDSLAKSCDLAGSAGMVHETIVRMDSPDVIARTGPTLVLDSPGGAPVSSRRREPRAARWIPGRARRTPGSVPGIHSSTKPRRCSDEIGRFIGIDQRRKQPSRPRARDRPVHRHRGLDREGRASATATWSDLLERHHDGRPRDDSPPPGKEVDTAGDGFFATFDGPARAVRCAEEIVKGDASHSGSRSAPGSTRARSASTARRPGDRRAHRGPGRVRSPDRRRSWSRRP